jgi:hypothetical protein
MFPRWIRTTLLLAAALTGVLLAAGRFTPVSSAEVFTCGATAPDNYHDGYFQAYNTQSFEGARADLTTQYGAVCDTHTTMGNFTNAYAMIASDLGVNGYGQAGYIRWYNHCTVYFAQQFDGGTDLQTNYGSSCLTDGNTHSYINRWNPDCHCLKSNVDSTTFLTSTWNPYDVWVFPFSPQFQGEARYLESDMPGNAANLTLYSSIQGQSSSDDSWQSYPCASLTKANDGSATRSDGEKWWDSQKTPCPNFVIYTDTS